MTEVATPTRTDEARADGAIPPTAEESAIIDDLRKRMEHPRVGRHRIDDALAEVRSVLGGGGGGSGGGEGKTATEKAKPKKKRKNWWDTATPAQKAARVKKMLAARGLKPKPAALKAGGKKPATKTWKSWWDTATEKQKADRVRKMQAGRGLKPKTRRNPK